MSRQVFEEEMYQRYFDAQTRDLALAPSTLTHSEYLARDADDNYLREDINAAWFAWCKRSELQTARIELEAKETECPLCRYSGNWMLHYDEDGRRYELRGLLVRLGAQMP